MAILFGLLFAYLCRNLLIPAFYGMVYIVLVVGSSSLVWIVAVLLFSRR